MIPLERPQVLILLLAEINTIQIWHVKMKKRGIVTQ